jgi:hypothetical protein
MFLQDKYSVQFDDLFKIAWEEDSDDKVPREDHVQQLVGDEETNGKFIILIHHILDSHEYLLLW